MPDIEWIDHPPPRAKPGPRNGRIKQAVTKLKERPGEWAIVARGQTRPGVANWKRYGVELTARREPDSDRYTFYARWPA